MVRTESNTVVQIDGSVVPQNQACQPLCLAGCKPAVEAAEQLVWILLAQAGIYLSRSDSGRAEATSSRYR